MEEDEVEVQENEENEDAEEAEEPIPLELLEGIELVDPHETAASTRGTITPKENFNEEWAAERLKKSMRGIGTDEKTIIKILVSHDNLQREAIEQKYKGMYGQDLMEDLKTELGGHFENAVVALLTSKYDLLVSALNDSFRFIGSDVNVLTEILCCQDAECINSLCWWYENNHNQSLEDALDSNLSGDFRAFMKSLLNANRPLDDDDIDEEKIKQDTQRLYDAGIGLNTGTDEREFINLLNNRSFVHLGSVFDEYERVANEPIENSIESEFSGDIKDCLLAIIKRVRDPYGFFAERLNMSMRGAATDDKTLIRIIISRSEEDLEDIKQRYMEMYGSSLASDIKDDTGGDYAKLLLAIINNNEQ